MSLAKSTITTLLILLAQSSVANDDTPVFEDSKREGVAYHSINKINIDTQHLKEFSDILDKYFYPAAVASEMEPPISYYMITGDTSVILIFPMLRGLVEYEYYQTKEAKSFFYQLNKLTGSEEKANEVFQRYLELIKDSEMDLAFTKNRQIPK